MEAMFLPLVCRVKGDSFVEIEYENKSVERIATGNKTVSQILETVQNKAEEMDTQQVSFISLFE